MQINEVWKEHPLYKVGNDLLISQDAEITQKYMNPTDVFVSLSCLKFSGAFL